MTDCYRDAPVPVTGGTTASVTIDPAAGKTIQLTGDVKHLTTDAVNGSLIDISMKMGSHSYVEPAWGSAMIKQDY